MSKQTIGVNIGSYTFSPAGAGIGTVTLLGIDNLALNQVLSIINVTDNIIIYSVISPLKGGSISSNVVTLNYDTSSMDASDKLQILIEYSDSSQPTNVIITGATGDFVDPIGGTVPVSFPAPSAPAASTPVNVSLALTAGPTKNEYIILNIPVAATKFVLLSFEADAKDSAKSTSAYVYYDAAGNDASGANAGVTQALWGDTLGAGWVEISGRLNISANPADKSFSASESKAGTATNRYIGRIKRNDGGSDDFSIRLKGYWT